ncbi:dihydroorotase [Gammaproteobacteria bacterium]|nr:dihydroorotase [Gammaproteobacteria bacterium]
MSSFDLILKNGTVFTPEATEITDIAVKDGKIIDFGSFNNAEQIIDCTNLYVFPGLIDTQCHFREPGGEHKETLETGTLSAALGGVTGIFEMPNTNPLTITPEAMEFKLKKAHETSYVDFAFYFGGTAEYAEHLSEWENIDGVCGIKIFMGASNGDLLSATDEEIDAIVANGKRVIAVHAEDESIMNENKVTILGDSNDVAMHYKWRSEESCLNATKRIVTIAKKYSRKVHILHITTAQEMAFLKVNKDIASAEVLANHLTLHAPDCYDMFGTLAQQNPPIREKHHQDALWAAVADGTVDIVASDHAPHTLDEKSGTYPNTPSGTPGVQTLIPIMLNHVHEGRLSYERLVDLMAYGPYRIHKIKNKCLIRKGFNADFTVIDPKAEHIISNAEQASKSGWTPYDGKKVVGFPTMTIIGGKTIMRDGEIIGRSNNQIEFNI